MTHGLLVLGHRVRLRLGPWVPASLDGVVLCYDTGLLSDQDYQAPTRTLS
jgi:hypothetical protein